jgi:hypothetical protein
MIEFRVIYGEKIDSMGILLAVRSGERLLFRKK